MAPTPAAMKGTRAPEAKNFVATAMLKRPVDLSRAMIDHVMNASFETITLAHGWYVRYWPWRTSLGARHMSVLAGKADTRNSAIWENTTQMEAGTPKRWVKFSYPGARVIPACTCPSKMTAAAS